MNCIIIAGKTGQGKSEVVKSLIQSAPCHVFDLYNEYGQRTKYEGQKPLNLSSDPKNPRSRHISGDFEKFAVEASTMKERVIVYEEATGFLEGKVGSIFKRTITNKMFTKNVYVFIFHTITDIPPAIMRLCDYLVLFKTNDERYSVERKYPRLLPFFDKLKTMNDGKSISLKLN